MTKWGLWIARPGINIQRLFHILCLINKLKKKKFMIASVKKYSIKLISIHDETLRKIGIEKNFLNFIKNTYKTFY